MQLFISAAILALAGAASAQSGCDAQNILNACTAQYKPQLQACNSQDWDCFCTTSTNLLTCYNNCPDDPTKSSVASENLQYCSAAKTYGSSSSSSANGMSMTASTSGASSGLATAASSSASPTLPAGMTASSSNTASATSSDNQAVATSSTINGSGTGAGNMVGPSIGALVVVLAGAVALL